MQHNLFSFIYDDIYKKITWAHVYIMLMEKGINVKMLTLRYQEATTCFSVYFAFIDNK